MTDQTYSSEQLDELIPSTENLTKAFADTHQMIKNEIEAVNQAIETWEKLAPQLYQM